MMMRRFIAVGNWKMNGSMQIISNLSKTLGSCCPDPKCNDIVMMVPSVYIQQARQCFPPCIQIGAQNSWKVPAGPFTGEISPVMIREVGGQWVLLGHSTRRHLFGEDNDLIGEKVGHALNEGLQVVACVGETSEERDNKKTEEVIIRQVCSIAKHVREWCRLVFAYEPLWAMGTGKCASPEDIQAVHCLIRRFLIEKVSRCVAEGVRITYGGNATPENCKDYIVQPDIDGFLVSESSMTPDFEKIMVCKKPDQ